MSQFKKKADDHAEPVSISDAEWSLMEVLWDKSPRTSPELCRILGELKEWKRATVMTLLTRLVAKGALDVAGGERSRLYSPAVSRDQCVSKETRGLLDRLFDGALLPMVAHCLEHHEMTEDELVDLQAMVDEAKRKSESSNK